MLKNSLKSGRGVTSQSWDFFFFYSFLLFSNGRCDWMFPNNSKRIEKKQKRKRNLQAVSQKRRTVGVKKGIKSKRPQAFANLRTEISACKTVTIMSTETCQFLLFPLSFLSLCSFIHGTSIKVSFFFQDFRLFFSVILTQIQYNPVYRAPRHSNDRAKHSFCWYWGVGGSVMAAQHSKKRFFRGTTYLPGEISTIRHLFRWCLKQVF